MNEQSQGFEVVEPGQLIGGKYRIGARLGAGAMGAVFEARHEQLGSRVALKFLLPHLSRVPVLAERFLREGHISATLNSPHVMQVNDVEKLPDGVPYLVMELLEGQSLHDKLTKTPVLEVEEAVDIALQILMGLQQAHDRGIVHRDLKPGNIFLTQRQQGLHVQILDFGIAKLRESSEFQALTKPGSMMGTPEYMAPEQALSAETATPQSDLYAVGVMLYEMLSGTVPASGNSPVEIAEKIRKGQIKPLAERCPYLPGDLCQLVGEALELKATSRPPSADAMRQRLALTAGRLSVSGALAAGRSLAPSPPGQSTSPQPGLREPTAQMAMPMPGFAAQPVSTVSMPPRTGPQNLPRKGRWLRLAVLMLVVLGFLGALAVAYQRWSLRQIGPPPPMPRPTLNR